MTLVDTVDKLLRRKAQPPAASFAGLLRQPCIHLYAGDLPEMPDAVHYARYVGLSLTRSDRRHIRHDVTKRMPLPDDCVDSYQSEDVFEHIDPASLPAVIDEIHRVLKPGGNFRLSMPDYGCDILRARTLRDDHGELAFDPVGGGAYENGKVVGGGHMWFPLHGSVKAILASTRFTDVTFRHYYDSSGCPVTHPVDYSLGHVMRTPDHDERVREPYRPMSIIVDCRK